jgi:cyanate permease
MINSGAHQEQEVVSPYSEDRPPYQRRYRWVMLALVWILYFLFGITIYSIGPLVTPIVRDLNISYSQMGLIAGAWPLTYIVVSAIGGAIIDRWGIRKSILVGVIFMSLSEILRYFAGGFGTMFFCVALFGLGGPLISIGVPKTISLWFLGKERGTAVGTYLTGVWIGGAVVLTTMNSIVMPLTGYSWRLAFLCFGLLSIVGALVWWLLARDVKSVEAEKSAPIKEVFGGIISLRNVQLIFLMGPLSFAIGHGMNNWLPKILETGGFSPAAAGFAASVPIWIGIPTLIIIPHMVAPHARGYFIALSSVSVAIAMLLIGMTTGIPQIIGLVIYGLAYAWVLPLLVLILMDLPEIGSKYMGSASGMYFCVAELGGFLGPLTIGAIKDWAGGFVVGTCFLAGLSFIRIFLALSLKIKRGGELKAQ